MNYAFLYERFSAVTGLTCEIAKKINKLKLKPRVPDEIIECIEIAHKWASIRHPDGLDNEDNEKVQDETQPAEKA
jgi:hypothetical protein